MNLPIGAVGHMSRRSGRNPDLGVLTTGCACRSTGGAPPVATARRPSGRNHRSRRHPDSGLRTAAAGVGTAGPRTATVTGSGPGTAETSRSGHPELQATRSIEPADRAGPADAPAEAIANGDPEAATRSARAAAGFAIRADRAEEEAHHQEDDSGWPLASATGDSRHSLSS